MLNIKEIYMGKFEDLGLSRHLLRAIDKFGFDSPTEIQEKTIPHILLGEDVIGESVTGSGKTLAFGCGIIEKIASGKGLQALVLTPTRELAEQVKNSLNQISTNQNLLIITVYGGVAIGPQIRDLSKAEVVVATPGRFLDHIKRNTINLSKIKIIVLDEADRMLDMGFIEDVERIIQLCPKNKQTLLFSATIPPRLKKLTERYLNRPVSIGAEKYVDPSKLTQYYYSIMRNQKLSLLVHLLKHEKSGLVIVFCNTRRTTDFVVKNLRINKVDAMAIHGGFSQNKRTSTMNLFDKGRVGVLVCTDVAARGIHIENVSHIYNYDLPKDANNYVHRIGRTARAGKEGKIINLLSEEDHDNFTRILDEYRSFSIEKAVVPDYERVFAVKEVQQRPWRNQYADKQKGVYRGRKLKGRFFREDRNRHF